MNVAQHPATEPRRDREHDEADGVEAVRPGDRAPEEPVRQDARHVDDAEGPRGVELVHRGRLHPT